MQPQEEKLSATIKYTNISNNNAITAGYFESLSSVLSGSYLSMQSRAHRLCREII